ncbi:MAG: hypothetical protein K6A78_10495 [Prevotella sp.]|nr:hypothetical protein [Prevotella sp.]
MDAEVIIYNLTLRLQEAAEHVRRELKEWQASVRCTNEPLCDYLVDMVNRRFPEPDAGSCIAYLQRMTEGLEVLRRHEQLAKVYGLDREPRIAEICDILRYDMNHYYAEEVVDCAQEVLRATEKSVRRYLGRRDAEAGADMAVRSVMDEVGDRIETLNPDRVLFRELQAGYLSEWVRRQYMAAKRNEIRKRINQKTEQEKLWRN